MDIRTIHDRTFRAVMADINLAKDFFIHYLPEHVAEHVDPYLIIDVHQIADDKLREHIFGILGYMMKHRHAEDIANILESILQELKILYDQGHNGFLGHLTEYAMRITKDGSYDKIINICNQIGESMEQKTRTIAEMLDEQGWERGMQQGMRQGAQQTIYKLAKSMLSEGMSVLQVAKITGLSVGEVNTVIH